MYRIMEMKSFRPNNASLYSFFTDDDGIIVELETKEDLDAKLEELLNDGYSKSELTVVKVVDYKIDATEYSDE